MVTQEEFNDLMDGMEEVNREMVERIEEVAPICHFRKMSLEESDSLDGHFDRWWECSFCGHIKEIF